MLGLGREEEGLVKEQFSNVVIPDASSLSSVLLVDSRTERRFFPCKFQKTCFDFPIFLPSFPSSSVLHSWKLKIFALISLSLSFFEEHCLQYFFTHSNSFAYDIHFATHFYSLFFRPITAAFFKKRSFLGYGDGV